MPSAALSLARLISPLTDHSMSSGEGCRSYIAIQPRIICALGTFAAQTLLKTNEKITALRGRVFDLNGVKVIPTYHPAFLLRNPEKKRAVWEDMKRILDLLKETGGRD